MKKDTLMRNATARPSQKRLTKQTQKSDASFMRHFFISLQQCVYEYISCVDVGCVL